MSKDPKEIAKELKEALDCVNFGNCNSQALFNAWNANYLQPHASGSYCGNCVQNLIKKINQYIEQNE